MGLATASYFTIAKTSSLGDNSKLILEDLQTLERLCKGKHIPLYWRGQEIGTVRDIKVDNRCLLGTIWTKGWLSLDIQFDNFKLHIDYIPKRIWRDKIKGLTRVEIDELSFI